MSEPSSERLKAAVLALYEARPVEGPPGDDGQRSVWHLSPQGAELLSFVDSEGRVQRQELTLLGEHCVWTNGMGLRTGRVEQVGAVRTEASVVHPDAQPIPARMLRAALALEDYQGGDRYILHIQRVLALARQGLILAGNAPASPVPVAPLPTAPAPTVSTSTSPASPPAAASPQPSQAPQPTPASTVDPIMLRRQQTEGLTMLIVLGLGLVVGVALFLWLI